MQETKHALRGLTGARFIAAFLVVITHTKACWPPLTQLGPLSDLAGPAVSFFFVLSGFILTYNYAERFRARATDKDSGNFWRARFARIYPMYLLALALSVPVVLCRVYFARPSHIESVWPGGIFATVAWMVNALLLQSYIPSRAVAGLWNGPGWSVACEAFFYALFPLITRVSQRAFRSGSERRFSVFIAVLLIVEFATILFLPMVVEPLFPGDRGKFFASSLLYYSPPCRLAEFILGCVVGHLYLRLDASGRLPGRRLRETALVVAVVVGIGIAFVSQGAGRFGFYALHTSVALVIVFVLASGRTTLGGFLDLPIMFVLGEASYSMYLIHFPILLLVDRFSGETWGLASAAVMFVLTPALAILFFYRYESPVRRKLRQYLAPGFRLENPNEVAPEPRVSAGS